MDRLGHLNFAERAREKQRARDIDAADLASGKRSAKQIQEQNSMFSGLPNGALRNAKIHFPERE